MMDESDVVASCENIHKTYLLGIEGVPALRGVSADVYRRDLLVIYGTSGGGKSTLLNVFGTIDVPTKGNLNLFRKRITERTPDAVLALLRCKKVGFVFQSFNLLSTMNAIDNVCLPMIIAGDRPADQIRARAKMLLEQVGLGHRLDHFPSQMSGGEQQRVTIARALANEPEMLLLDEPTGDLDTRNTHRVLSILLDLNLNKGLTMAMVTHDVYMKQYATRVLYLRDGRVNRIETMDPRMRLAAVEHLKATVEKETLDSRRVSAQTTVANETRQPADYDTFSPRADGRVFFRHENPYLFQKLFGAKRDGFQAVLQQQQLQAAAAGAGGVVQAPIVSGSPQPAVVNVPGSVATPAGLGSPYPPAATGAVGVDRSAIASALANASTAGAGGSGGGALSARRVPLPEDPKDAAFLRSAQGGRSYEQFQGQEMGAVSSGAGIVPDVSALMAAAARSMVATATDAPGAVQHLRTASLRVAAPVSVHMTMPSQHAAAALREAQARHLRTLSGGIGGAPSPPMQVHTATGVYSARAAAGGVGPAEFATPATGGVAVMAGGVATAASSQQQQISVEGHVVQRANTAVGAYGGDSIWIVSGSPVSSPVSISMANQGAAQGSSPRVPQGQTPGDAFSAAPV